MVYHEPTDLYTCALKVSLKGHTCKCITYVHIHVVNFVVLDQADPHVLTEQPIEQSRWQSHIQNTNCWACTSVVYQQQSCRRPVPVPVSYHRLPCLTSQEQPGVSSQHLATKTAETLLNSASTCQLHANFPSSLRISLHSCCSTFQYPLLVLAEVAPLCTLSTC